MKKEEYFQKLVKYAKKIFGLALIEVWIVKKLDNDGFYYNIEFITDLPLEILKQYHQQIQEYYIEMSKKQKFDINVYLAPRQGFPRNILAMHGKKRIYKRPDCFDIQELLPTKS